MTGDQTRASNDAPPSLDYSIKTVDEVCKRRPSQLIVSISHPGRVALAGCGAYQCSVCGPRKVRKVVAAMSYVTTRHDRMRFVTLTQAPEDLTKRLQKMKDLTRWAKAQGFHWQMAWTTEQGSSTGMTHVHAMQWGDFVPQKALQSRWGAIVDIRAIKSSAGAVGGYMAKGAGVGHYMAKEARGEAYEGYLKLSGGRPIRWSRDFYSGLTVPEAAKSWRRLQPGYEEMTWRPASDAEAWTYQREGAEGLAWLMQTTTVHRTESQTA